MSDVQFAVGRQRGAVKIFSAHKFLLSVRSDVFRAMFYGELPENTAQPIDIPEILPAAFACMLSFVYTGTVEAVEGLPPPSSLVCAESVTEVLYCADKYHLPQLTKMALNAVLSRLDHASCLDYLENAQRWPLESCARVVQECLYWVDVCSDVVLGTERFCALAPETLQLILQRNTLCVDENAVYTAAEKWAAAACLRNALDASPGNRRAMLGPALFLIRFPLLTDAQLTDGPVQSGLLLDSEVVALYRYKHAAVRPLLPFAAGPRAVCAPSTRTPPDAPEGATNGAASGRGFQARLAARK
ncbi:BTB/POZ domain-containing protein 6-like [Paramacrobiotus metropolitanus]|uniref:BTB/POZ domain-containing protein 6-like n=1 Tax=Paramacrobiotus metropolitanus TaxID=2943436 RepID=UPI0024457730|nr:BTB/POZ domain-containing protein 6-like [Paramacrobiotus metropolitanus]